MPSYLSFRQIAWVLLPAVVTWAVVSRGIIGMSPDSLFYWSAARTISEQHVLATQVSPRDYVRTVGDLTRPDSGVSASDGTLVYPLTTWPPGYPLVLAAVMPLAGGSAIAAARIVAAFTLVLLVAAFAMVGSHLVDLRRAIFAAGLVACLPFVHTCVRMMWSDALFAALALAALAMLAWAFSPVGRPRLALSLTVLLLALATYLRYTGILVALAAIVAGGIIVPRTPARRALAIKGALAVVCYGLLVAPLFARNFSLAGDLSGGEHAPAGESGLWLFGAFLTAFARGVLPWVGNAIPGPRDALVTGGVSLAAWAVAGIALLAAGRSNTQPSAASSLVRRPMGLILLVCAAFYGVVLLVLRTRWHFDFNTRMLLPAVASLVLLLVCAFQDRIADDGLWRVNRVALVLVPLVTIASLAAADRYVPWQGYNSASLSNRPVARWARAAIAQVKTGTHARFASVGYLIPYLSFTTAGAGVSGLPDVPEPRVLLAHSPYTATVVILEPGGRRFLCPEYQRAFEDVLTGAADSVFHEDQFTAWWLSAASVRRLEEGAAAFAPSCH